MNKLINGGYQSPAVLEWTVLNEGVLCISGNNEAYAGEGSDNYQELF
jgi:hypothetical protein